MCIRDRYVALLETCQQPDGSIRIPEALVPYFGADSIRPAQGLSLIHIWG